jgi:hypothetical protein
VREERNGAFWPGASCAASFSTTSSAARIGLSFSCFPSMLCSYFLGTVLSFSFGSFFFFFFFFLFFFFLLILTISPSKKCYSIFLILLYDIGIKIISN